LYDEAQRAWDAEWGVRTAGTGQLQNRTISFTFAERMNSWALMVALIGEGQILTVFC
jgi:hypothetical protein